jgi:cytochrome b561
MWKNTTEQWGSLARALHWGMAILLLAQVVLGKVGHEMTRSPAKFDILTWHKSIGVLLLLLVLLRLAWRGVNPTPTRPPSVSSIQNWAARSAHAALYVLMLALPLSGWVMNSASNIPFKVFWLVSWPDITGPSRELAELAEEVHEALAVLLMVLVAAHVLAALWHHFSRHDPILMRMLRSGNEDR